MDSPLVCTEADPQVQEKTNEWFTAHHIPERMMVPGFLISSPFFRRTPVRFYKWRRIWT
jgi:3-hydroxymyristoyl/3-hydroxydecanoyl-(acyl carrier protein) dehydratase